MLGSVHVGPKKFEKKKSHKNHDIKPRRKRGSSSFLQSAAKVPSGDHLSGRKLRCLLLCWKGDSLQWKDVTLRQGEVQSRTACPDVCGRLIRHMVLFFLIKPPPKDGAYW